jgi:nicotinamidase-related amidase
LKSINFVIMVNTFNPLKTALLLLDLQAGNVERLPPGNSVLENAALAIAIARQYGAQVVYIRTALDEAEVDAIPDHSPTFAKFKEHKEISAGIIHPDVPTTQIHPAVAPRDDELVFRKIRFGAFITGPAKALLDVFASKGIDTVIVGGVSTSGAVLSTVTQLSDLDFQLFLLEDCCVDRDAGLHQVLFEKVFSTQAKLIRTSELEGLF